MSALLNPLRAVLFLVLTLVASLAAAQKEPPLPSQLPSTNQPALEQRLSELRAEARRSDLAQVQTADLRRFHLLLAARFEYDVRQGGFAQLFYNMQGDFLADMEDMLIAADAPVAHEYYVRAVRACLKDKANYTRFLESNYTDENEVKTALQLLSLEYMSKQTPFAAEAEHFLAE